MTKQFLHIDDHLAMLNDYAPFDVEVEIPDADGVISRLKLVGCDFKAKMGLLDSDYGVRPHSPAVFQPVLYSLADLPDLLGGDSHSFSALAAFIHGLAFIERGDYGSGEWVSQVTVKSAGDAQLHVAFSTSYTHLWEVETANSDYDADETGPNEDDFDPEYGRGADYEVIISAVGNVHWRNVTADSLEGERGQHWRVAQGANVFEAFGYLRRLHVAVGRAAYVHQVWSNAAKGYTPHYSYVRKQVSAAQEGGQAT